MFPDASAKMYFEEEKNKKKQSTSLYLSAWAFQVAILFISLSSLHVFLFRRTHVMRSSFEH